MLLRRWWIIGLSFLWFALPGLAQTNEGIHITIPDVSLTTDDHVLILVQIACPTAICAAVDVALQYDPTQIELYSVAWGDFVGIDGQDILTVSHVQDSQAGLLRVAYLTLPTALSTSQAEGDLLILGIHALAPGTSTLTITEVLIGTEDSLRIEPVTSQPGIVTIVDPIPTAEACRGDIDGNGIVNESDLNQLLLAYNLSSPPNLDADVNADGMVNILDAIIINGNLNLSVEECGS